MKILMLTPYLPYPLHSGGQTRSFNLIKNLGKKHQITLFSFIREDKEKRYRKNLAPYCQQIKLFKRRKAWAPINVLLAGFSPYPLLVSIYFSRSLRKAIARELNTQNYDLIHVENFYLMQNIPKTKVPILLVDQTIEHRVYQHFVDSLPKTLIFLKPFLLLDVAKIKFWETFYWKKASMMVAVSQEDKKLMQSQAKDLEVKIVPNGVDRSYFQKRVYPRAKKPVVLFGLANFKWMQNKEGAQILINHVWPLIKKKIPEAKLWIVGRYAPEFFKGLKEKDVVVKEGKPKKIYQQAWALVAPMRSGGGSRTKFFEAMASKLPIVTTPKGAEGIAAQDGKEIFISDDLQDLAEKAVKLLKNRDLAENIAKKAKELTKKKYGWDKSAQKLDQAYQEVAHGKKS